MSWPQLTRHEFSVEDRRVWASPTIHAAFTTLIMSNPNVFISAKELFEAVYYMDPNGGPLGVSRTSTWFITILKRHGVMIESVHGWGYRIPHEGRMPERPRLKPSRLAQMDFGW
jgi:biotin operon repressor